MPLAKFRIFNFDVNKTVDKLLLGIFDIGELITGVFDTHGQQQLVINDVNSLHTLSFKHLEKNHFKSVNCISVQTKYDKTSVPTFFTFAINVIDICGQPRVANTFHKFYQNNEIGAT